MNAIHNLKSYKDLYGEIIQMQDSSDESSDEENNIDRSDIEEEIDGKMFKKQLTKKEFKNLLLYAIDSENLEIVEFAFIFPIDVNTPYLEVSPLMWSAKHDNLEITDFLLRKGAKLDYIAQCNVDYNCLTTAIIFGHLSVVRYFLDLGINPNSDDKGHNALKIAVESVSRDTRIKLKDEYIKEYDDREKIVSLLLERGANPNKYTGGYYDNHEGCSILLILCSYHMNNLLEQFLKYGADVNYFGENGDNVINRCIFGENYEGIKIVLQYGFDINKLDFEVRTHMNKILKKIVTTIS
jgi:ankyrin repeat protein